MINSKHLGYLLLSLIGVLTYGPVLQNQYTLDDVVIVAQNPILKPGSSWTQLWRSSYWDAKRFPERGLYRPLTMSSFKLIQSLDKHALIANHLLNLMLHLIVGGLLYALLLCVGAAPWSGCSLVLLYLTHPAHTEVVAGLVGRGDLLVTVFSLMTLLYLWQAWPFKHTYQYWFLALALLAALFSKESAIAIILILPAWIWYIYQQQQLSWPQIGRQIIRLAFIICMCCGLYLLCRYLVLGYLGLNAAGQNQFGDSLAQRLITALAFDSYYLQKIVAPLPLTADYTIGLFALHGIEYNLRAIIATVWIGITIWQLCQFVRQPTLARFGITGFFLATLPVNNLLMVIGTPFAERLLYLPMVFAIFALLQPVWKKDNAVAWQLKSPLIWLMALIILGFAFISHIQSRLWKNNLTLSSAMLLNYPDNVVVAADHAISLWEVGRDGEAMMILNSLAQRWPTSYLPYAKMTLMALQANQLNQAAAHYKEASQRATTAQLLQLDHELQTMQPQKYKTMKVSK